MKVHDRPSHIGDPHGGDDGMARGRRLIRREGIWHYHRRVPRAYAAIDSRSHVTVSLGTRDLAAAERAKVRVEEDLEAFWRHRAAAGSPDPRDRYEGASRLAAVEGHPYRVADDLARAQIEDILARLDRIERVGLIDMTAQAALLGGVERPQLTFREATDRFLAAHEATWRNPKHRAQWRATLESYAFPAIGELDVAEIETAHVVKCLEPIWARVPETGSRLRGRIERVLDWARAHGYRRGDNPARWRGHLREILAEPKKLRPVTHHAALPWRELPAFMAALREREGVSARALEFTILTAARTGAVIGAGWDEIDLDGAVWTVPARRTGAKTDRPRRVPLTAPVLALLGRLRDGGASDGHVFPGRRGAGLSNMAMTELVRGIGVDATVHGFRSTFKDWCAEATSYPNELSEAALWHVVADKVEAAYRRGELFEKRRTLMEDWAVFCGSAAHDSTPTNIR